MACAFVYCFFLSVRPVCGFVACGQECCLVKSLFNACDLLSEEGVGFAVRTGSQSSKLQRRCKSDSRSRGQAPAFTIGEECEHADAWWRKTWLSLFATIHLSECKACFSKKLVNCKRRELRSCSALQGLSLRTYGQCRTFVGTPYQDGSSSSCTSERP